MKTELKPLTFNAKRWREENGYTSPEWEMYAENCVYVTMIFCILFFFLGAIAWSTL